MVVYIILALVGFVLLLAGIFGVYGSTLPVTHTASVSVTLNKPREEVWRIINDIEAFPQWMKTITKVEMLPDGPGGERTFREHMGRNSFVLRDTNVEPGKRVVRTIVDDNGPFSGSWDHVLESTSDSTTKFTLTETGSIKSPIPRAVMKLFFGYDHYLKIAAEQLKAKCQ